MNIASARRTYSSYTTAIAVMLGYQPRPRGSNRSRPACNGTVSNALASWEAPSAARCVSDRTADAGTGGSCPGSASDNLRIEVDGLGLPLLVKGAILSRHR